MGAPVVTMTTLGPVAPCPYCSSTSCEPGPGTRCCPDCSDHWHTTRELRRYLEIDAGSTIVDRYVNHQRDTMVFVLHDRRKVEMTYDAFRRAVPPPPPPWAEALTVMAFHQHEQRKAEHRRRHHDMITRLTRGEA